MVEIMNNLTLSLDFCYDHCAKDTNVNVSQVKPSVCYQWGFTLYITSDWVITSPKSTSQISDISAQHSDQTSVEDTATMFSLNKQNLLLIRLHPPSPYDHHHVYYSSRRGCINR